MTTTRQDWLFDDQSPAPAPASQAICGKCGRAIPDGQLGCVRCAAEGNMAELLASQPDRLRHGGSRVWLRITQNDRHVLIYGSDRVTFCGIELRPKTKSKDIESTGRKPKALRLRLFEKPCDAETLATVCPGCRIAIERALEPRLP